MNTDAQLYRYDQTDEGTFGFIAFAGQRLYTGELPWHDNQPEISCIPAGLYTVQMRHSPKYGDVYEVTDVYGRSYILFHQGNFCGDLALGFRTNVLGCILLGKRRGRLYGQQAVLVSRGARSRFEAVMGMKTFTLEIIELWQS